MRRVNKLTSFGVAVKKKALEQNITMVELAVAVGTNPQYLNRILSGDRAGYKYRDAIVHVLGMSEKWLDRAS